MLLLLASVAWPCDYAPPDVSVVPGFGTLKPGTVLRVSADDVEGELLDEADQDTDLLALPIAPGWTGLTVPEDLPEGAYALSLTAYTGSGSYERRSYSFAGEPPSGAMSGEVELLEVLHETGVDPDGDPCDTGGAEQLLTTATFSIPAAPEAGWVARLSEARSGKASAFFTLETDAPVSRSITVAQDPDAPGEVCPEVDVFDARHERVGGLTPDCVTPEVGRCATGGGRGAGVGAVLLALLLGRRRRRA
ncbi:MAG: hypothetical protein H6741_27710 [Alphaproteobacteria bacterium]|nr:hypothetical protein [Alphaproteobacteria bacterium]